MAISILLADDHPRVRLGIRTLLETEPYFTIVAEAGDGLEAQTLVERLKPDVMILDLLMPKVNGFEVLRQMPQLSPTTRVLILSAHAHEAYVLEALRHGAAGYALKRSDLLELAEAIRQVKAGQSYLSPAFTPERIKAYERKVTGALPASGDSHSPDRT